MVEKIQLLRVLINWRSVLEFYLFLFLKIHYKLLNVVVNLARWNFGFGLPARGPKVHRLIRLRGGVVGRTVCFKPELNRCCCGAPVCPFIRLLILHWGICDWLPLDWRNHLFWAPQMGIIIFWQVKGHLEITFVLANIVKFVKSLGWERADPNLLNSLWDCRRAIKAFIRNFHASFCCKLPNPGLLHQKGWRHVMELLHLLEGSLVWQSRRYVVRAYPDLWCLHL